MKIKKLAREAEALAVFADLKQDPVLQKFFTLLNTRDLPALADFASALYATGSADFPGYIKEAVFNDDNCLVKLSAKKQPIPEQIRKAAVRELNFLEAIAQLSAQDFIAEGEVPGWKSGKLELLDSYGERLGSMDKIGYGPFARYHMFRLIETKDGYEIRPVAAPDPIRYDDLIGYEKPREQVVRNTRALLRGTKAANILLYGDAGTGKSATVKATANEYKNQALRLIELSKNELHLLPDLMDELAANPLKFILFIDDLSFQENDDDFAALKAVLEGSASVRAGNTVIYATSNRRHIVRETFQAREGDEIHRRDTMQETISLSERFGLTVYFEKPDAKKYTAIVEGLAAQAGLDMDPARLKLLAEQFAQRKAGRSARAARQFVDQLEALEEDN